MVAICESLSAALYVLALCPCLCEINSWLHMPAPDHWPPEESLRGRFSGQRWSELCLGSCAGGPCSVPPVKRLSPARVADASGPAHGPAAAFFCFPRPGRVVTTGTCNIGGWPVAATSAHPGSLNIKWLVLRPGTGERGGRGVRDID